MTCDVCPPPSPNAATDAPGAHPATDTHASDATLSPAAPSPTLDVGALAQRVAAGATTTETSPTMPARATAATLVRLVQSWDRVSLAPHDTGSVAIVFDDVRIGVISTSGLVEVSFPDAIRDALLSCGLASTTRYVSDTGVVRLRMTTTDDVRRGASILQLAHVYRRIVKCRSAADLAVLYAEIHSATLPDAVRAPFLRILDCKRQGFE